MFTGGTLIIVVGNLDAATRFYTQPLGLKLTHRFGNRWVTVDAGPSCWTREGACAGLVLGLQPHTSVNPAPGTRGAVSYGFETYDALDACVPLLAGRGVTFESGIITFEAGKCIALADPEGNPSYLWEITDDMLEGKAPPSRNPAAPVIAGGQAIVYVSNMDKAVRFYTEVLGLPLTYRYEDKIAFVEAGRLVIALHPTSERYPAPGTRGAVRLALHVDEPMDRVLSRLAARGVRLAGGAPRGEQATTLIEDQDGNPIELIEESALVGAAFRRPEMAVAPD